MTPSADDGAGRAPDDFAGEPDDGTFLESATNAAAPHRDLESVLAVDRLLQRYLPFRRLGVRGLRVLSGLQTRIRNRNPPAVGEVVDGAIPGPAGELPVRAYRPPGEGPFPTAVFFHGGAFVIGGLDSHDSLCRQLCREAGVVVLAVDYRLAPEHRFPAPLADAYAAVEWAAAHADRLSGDGSLAVVGDSAGGTLAATVSLLARDRGGPRIDHQALVYPAVALDPEQRSVREHGGTVLSVEDLEWIRELYYGSELHLRNPYADPAEARDLSGLPPATVVTAGFDPLRDGGARYADLLAAAGVPVRFRNYPDAVHGFATMLDGEGFERAHELVADLATDLAAALGDRG